MIAETLSKINKGDDNTFRRYIPVIAGVMMFCLAAIVFTSSADASDDVQYDDYGSFWGYTIGFTFTGEGATGGVVWTFSDDADNSVTGYSCQHRFPAIGNYTVTMRSTNSGPDGVSGTSDDLVSTTIYTIEIKGYPYIDYVSNGGSSVPRTQQTLAGVPATQPADPTKTGYTFAGWYTDSALTQQYDWSSNVMSPITLYAKWTEAPVSTHEVTFNTNGGSSISKQTVTDGSCATKPSDPTKTGYTFSGWYSNASLTSTYVWSTPITSDTTIYAGWTAVSITTYRVTFSTGETVNVVSGQTVAKPTDPVRTGYTFSGWYADENCTTQYNFSSPVTKNTSIYAKWTAVDSGSDSKDSEKNFIEEYTWVIPAVICGILVILYFFSMSRSPVILILAAIAGILAVAFFTGMVTYEQIEELLGGKKV